VTPRVHTGHVEECPANVALSEAVATNRKIKYKQEHIRQHKSPLARSMTLQQINGGQTIFLKVSLKRTSKSEGVTERPNLEKKHCTKNITTCNMCLANLKH